MYTVYGIPNCGSVKKAVSYLEKKGISYEFVNFKKTPVSAERLKNWMSQQPLEVIVNKKGTSWRQLDAAVKEQELTEDLAVELITHNNSLIKRPVITQDEKVIVVGFDEKRYDTIF